MIGENEFSEFSELPGLSDAELDSRTRQHLIRQLFKVGPLVIVAGQSVATIIFLALMGESYVGLTSWFLTFTAISMTRMILTFGFRFRRNQETGFRRWTMFYIVGAVLSGFAWAALIVFCRPPHPLLEQLFLLIILVAMPVAAMPAYAIYQPVYSFFSFPILGVLLLWSMNEGDVLKYYFATVAVTYAVVLSVTSWTFHRNMRLTIATRLKNQNLLKLLSEKNQELSAMAYHDPLTGLTNRRGFKEQARKTFERSRDKGTRLAVMLIDLDDFKRVNDDLGHSAGDRLLAVMAERLTHSLRHTDKVARQNVEAARFGGDEFIVLLEEIEGREGVQRTIDRVMSTLSEPIMLEGSQYQPSVSIGIAISPNHGESVEALTRSADIAMYAAKKGGKKQYRYFDPFQAE